MKKLIYKLTGHRFTRFLLVGFSNAALHFSVLNACFYILDASKIVASLVATICAVTYSFFLNRGFVFKAKDKNALRLVALFALVTLSGMLFIHNLTYVLSIHLLSGHEEKIAALIFAVTGQVFSNDFIDINLATVFGAIAALIWNYNGYRLFVFPNGKITEADNEEN